MLKLTKLVVNTGYNMAKNLHLREQFEQNIISKIPNTNTKIQNTLNLSKHKFFSKIEPSAEKNHPPKKTFWTSEKKRVWWGVKTGGILGFSFGQYITWSSKEPENNTSAKRALVSGAATLIGGVAGGGVVFAIPPVVKFVAKTTAVVGGIAITSSLAEKINKEWIEDNMGWQKGINNGRKKSKEQNDEVQI